MTTPWRIFKRIKLSSGMGPLQLTVKWCRIRHPGEQVAHWDIQNKPTSSSQIWIFFVLDVSVRSLLSNMADFVPCDRWLQRAHSNSPRLHLFKMHISLSVSLPGQGFPPWVGVGLSHIRIRVLVPSLHVLLQERHSDQRPQCPSIGATKWKLWNKYDVMF